jgi:CPA1 family monovalent cation:H+ antiporter
MNLLTIVTGIIALSAAISYLNHRFIKLPGTIGVMTISMVASILLLVLAKLDGGKENFIGSLASSIDFSRVLLNLMLGLLLFAMALHFDYRKLKNLRRAVITLSTFGVLISTAVFGFLFFGLTLFLSIEVPLLYCFIFGALISPTDPIAVASILKKSKIPPQLDTIISGESMFNDAVGLILFLTLLDIVNPLTPNVTFGQTMQLLAQEVIGGIGIGLVLGFIAYRLIKSIHDFQTIFLISLALVLGISVVAEPIHASMPLAAVTAGLFIGNQSYEEGHPAGRFLGQIWSLLDEVLNTILFVLIGLQLVLLPSLEKYWLPGILSIGIILIARLVSIAIPGFVLLRRVSAGSLAILTWAGLRGGISVAMALSLPVSPYRNLILSCCYFIVIFSVVVQGLTLNRVVNKVVGIDAS